MRRDNVNGRENGMFASKTGILLRNSLPGFVGVNVIRLPGGESVKNIMAGATRKYVL